MGCQTSKMCVRAPLDIRTEGLDSVPSGRAQCERNAVLLAFALTRALRAACVSTWLGELALQKRGGGGGGATFEFSFIMLSQRCFVLPRSHLLISAHNIVTSFRFIYHHHSQDHPTFRILK